MANNYPTKHPPTDPEVLETYMGKPFKVGDTLKAESDSHLWRKGDAFVVVRCDRIPSMMLGDFTCGGLLTPYYGDGRWYVPFTTTPILKSWVEDVRAHRLIRHRLSEEQKEQDKKDIEEAEAEEQERIEEEEKAYVTDNPPVIIAHIVRAIKNQRIITLCSPSSTTKAAIVASAQEQLGGGNGAFIKTETVVETCSHGCAEHPHSHHLVVFDINADKIEDAEFEMVEGK